MYVLNICNSKNTFISLSSLLRKILQCFVLEKLDSYFRGPINFGERVEKYKRIYYNDDRINHTTNQFFRFGFSYSGLSFY